MNEKQMHRDATLEQLAKTVASLQSFNYDTFDAARESVNIDGAEYVFDKLSLCGYAHKLSGRISCSKILGKDALRRIFGKCEKSTWRKS